MKDHFYFPISINWLQRGKLSRAFSCAVSHKDGLWGWLSAPLLTRGEQCSSASPGKKMLHAVAPVVCLVLSSKRTASSRVWDWFWGGHSPWGASAKTDLSLSRGCLRVPWVVLAHVGGARPSFLGWAWAARCVVAALSTETSLQPVPTAMSIAPSSSVALDVLCAPTLLSPL